MQRESVQREGGRLAFFELAKRPLVGSYSLFVSLVACIHIYLFIVAVSFHPQQIRHTAMRQVKK